MLVRRRRLDDSLDRERNPTDPEAFQDLHDDKLSERIGALPESDHQPESECLDGKPADDDPFDAPGVANQKGGEDGDDGGCEGGGGG